MKKRWMSFVSLILACVLMTQPVLATGLDTNTFDSSSTDSNVEMVSPLPGETSSPENIGSKMGQDDELGTNNEVLEDEEPVGVNEPVERDDSGTNRESIDTNADFSNISEENQDISAKARIMVQPQLNAGESDFVEGLNILPNVSRIGLGTSVTLQGNIPEISEGATYRYIYLYNGSWIEIYSDEIDDGVIRSADWTPTGKGSYLLDFQVIEKNGEVTNYFSFGFEVVEPVISITGITTTQLPDGKTIEIKPQYTGNISVDLVSFTYMLYDINKGVWSYLAKDEGCVADWIPKSDGGYLIHVIAKTASKESIYTIGYVVSPPSITDFYVKEVDADRRYNKPVTLVGEVKNSIDQKLTYEFLAYNGRFWNSIYKSDDLCEVEYLADKPGDYLLCFQIISEDNRVLQQNFMGYTALDEYVKLADIHTTVTKDKVISLDVDVETNSESVEYRWLYYDPRSGLWGMIQDWSDQKNAIWEASNFDNYLLHVEARTKSGKTEEKTIVYAVAPLHTELTNMMVYTADYKTFIIGQYADTNDQGLKYKYLDYNVKHNCWESLPDLGGMNTFWTPKESGNYLLHVIVTDSNGKEYTNTIVYGIKGYKITKFGFDSTLEAGKAATLSLSGNQYLNEGYTFEYAQWNSDGWTQLYYGTTEKDIRWTPGLVGYYAFACTVRNADGDVVDESVLQITPDDFNKNGWYYEDGYKFYYINGVKQLDLDGILPPQDSYIAKVNRKTCTVTIYAKDGANGYIIPVKRFACSVGLPATPTPAGTYYTLAKYRWATLMGPSYGQYCTRIVDGILFHSVAGSNTTSFNLNPAAYNQLGYPASHGCVRLCVRDAKWIYDNCKLGMETTIYDSSYPGPLGQGPIIRITNPAQNWDPTDPNV